MCLIANPGEIKFLFLLSYPGKEIFTYVVRSNLSHRDRLCIPAGGVGAALGALWPDVDSKGAGGFHFTRVTFTSAATATGTTRL